MDMIEKAIEAIKASGKESSVYVGTDSIRFKKKGIWHARYSTVIILHMDTRSGCKLFHESVDMVDYGNLKQRLLNEAMYAINAASQIIDHLEGRRIEVHLDLNPNPKHKSNIAVAEALGYVKGQLQLDAKIKPYSFAATHCADHAVRGKLH